MNVNLKLEKSHLPILGAAVLVLLLIYGIYSVVTAVRKDQHAEVRCEKSCEEYKSVLIDGLCYCSTDVGFVRAGQVKGTLKKIYEQCPTTQTAAIAKVRRKRR